MQLWQHDGHSSAVFIEVWWLKVPFVWDMRSCRIFKQCCVHNKPVRCSTNPISTNVVRKLRRKGAKGPVLPGLGRWLSETWLIRYYAPSKTYEMQRVQNVKLQTWRHETHKQCLALQVTIHSPFSEEQTHISRQCKWYSKAIAHFEGFLQGPYNQELLNLISSFFNERPFILSARLP
jgi:hypothetical protein